MPAKKSVGSSLISSVVLILLIVAAAAVIVAPLALTILWIIYEVKARRFVGKSTAVLLPPPQDLAELRKLAASIEEFEGRISHVEEAATRAGARRRVDGLFDNRSLQGQRANETLAALFGSKQQLQDIYNSKLEECASLARVAVKTIATVRGARLGVFCILPIFCLVLASSQNALISVLICGALSALLAWGRARAVRSSLEDRLGSN